MQRTDIEWASGLFEGEGSISLRRLKTPGRSKQPTLQMQMAMTDEDSLRRFARAVGLGTIGGPIRQPSWPDYYKSQWVWRCSGFERCQAVIAMLWNGLGARRRDKAKEALAATRVYKVRRDPNTGRLLPYVVSG